MAVDPGPGVIAMMGDMTIAAVVFDIGGILEITPSLAVTERWESRLGLEAGEISNPRHQLP